MKRVLVWLAVLATVFGALAAVGQNREVIDAALSSVGIDPENTWFKEGLKLLLYVFIGGPILGLMNAVFALGQDVSSKDIHGYTVLYLKSGVRFTLPVAALALAALMFFVSSQDEGVWVQFGLSGFGLAFLLAGLAVFRARLRYDGTSLFVRGPLGGESRYDWVDLEQIENLPDSSEYKLTFAGNRRVRISYYYSGVSRLIWLANERRRGHARTP